MNKQEWEQSSYLAGGNAPYVEELYDAYLLDPDSVSTEWQQFFKGVLNGGTDVSHADIREAFRQRARQVRGSAVVSTGTSGCMGALTQAYRRYGHYSAHFNPLHAQAPALDPHLDPARYGVDAQAQQSQIKALHQAYCGSIGYEFSFIDNDAEREWLQQQIEGPAGQERLTAEQQKTLLWQLVSADTLEKYLDVKYVGQKRFSVEGLDSLIPLLRELTECASRSGLEELILAMAHRGRLNVLINVMGRASGALFDEFDGKHEQEDMTSGDVKYHRGFSSDVVTHAGQIHLSLMFNPSHLEFINPVAMGSTRARQDAHDKSVDYAMPIIMHGDAAFAGQGVVMETLSMSQTRAYTVGGSLHIIANNQIGFTTSDPRDSRSSHYSSDLAKMISAPIFHVNADDAEAVIKVARLAFAYRQKFHKDVLIDLVGYRRHGHQEVDEPRATQPGMYLNIKSKAVVPRQYADKLIAEGVITDADYKQMIQSYRDLLDQGKETLTLSEKGLAGHNEARWSSYLNREWEEVADTRVSKETIASLVTTLTDMPGDMLLHRNVANIVKARRKMAAGEQPIDWGFGEVLAYATLLAEGHDVRLTGEDVRRGTFYHRHVRHVHQETDEEVMPLQTIADQHDAHLTIFDSLLSETGAMGFEYGYSSADPNGLVLWEAQFGDFANVAQVIVDQFLSSAWEKWNRLSGLVLLLPHGYEGMGPEHSSARLERYLQLCAQRNMQVCVPTTPAQMFHLLRRQVLRPLRKPLIVMTPKSLLRHKLATSMISDFTLGGFLPVFPEVDKISPENVKRLIFCSGKVYYELLQQRRTLERNDVVIIRFEQLYPFPYEAVREQFVRYANATEFVWCQEEPKNQGAWFWLRDRFAKILPEGSMLRYAGRASSAAPACGYASLHKREQAALVDQAFGDDFNAKETIKF